MDSIEIESRWKEVLLFHANLSEMEKADDASKVDILLLMRASLLIMIYNNVEFVVDTCILEIHGRIASGGIAWTALSEDIQKARLKLVWRDLSAMNGGNAIQGLGTFLSDYNKQPLPTPTIRKLKTSYQGILDARKIREIAGEYGIVLLDACIGRTGDSLLTIKDIRNKLTHGERAFREVARDYTHVQITDFMESAGIYLKSLVNSVTRFIDEKEYISQVRE